MNYKKYYKASLIFAAVALCLALFLPARIGTHREVAEGMVLKTHERSTTLLWYFLLTQPDDGDTRLIGTTPYAQYYVKTYAIEIWVLAVIIFYIGLWKQQRRMRAGQKQKG